MLQNFRVTASTVFELLREKQLGGGVGKTTPSLRFTLELITEFNEFSIFLSGIKASFIARKIPTRNLN